MHLTLKSSTTQGSFFKNNNLTSFHPLLLKTLLFSEIASPSSVPFSLPHSSSSSPSHLCHVLVFICWFCSSSFSPCVKKKKNERLKIGWVKGGQRQEAKAATTLAKSLSAAPRPALCFFSSCFSALAVTDYNRSPKLHPYTSQAAHWSSWQCWMTVYQCDIVTAWPEEQQWSATGSCIRAAFEPHPHIQAVWKAKSGACMFFWISYHACTECDRRGKVRITVCLSLPRSLLLLDVLSAILLHVKGTERMEVRAVRSGGDSAFFSSFFPHVSLVDFIFTVARAWEAAVCTTWLYI